MPNDLSLVWYAYPNCFGTHSGVTGVSLCASDM